ncbi:MAG TPA: cbb3-type cytochrome c oxidase subunit 3 [Casimicrobiaceae bacterium]|nr:cbb3-type cytochrome c oxidase subunit 3 [Casimicrobiaceae bacterium]
MDTSTLLHSVMTLITFVTFLGIVFWAWSSKRTPEFEAAANAPFALPDDAKGPADSAIAARGGRPS